MKKIVSQALAAVALVAPLAASANGIIVLDFEGIGDGQPVGDYYNGAGPANKNFGVSFSPVTLALIDADAGGGGNFANEPSPDTIMFFLEANDAILNYAAGFTTGFSFFYSSFAEATVNVYDGLGATGNLLASLSLRGQWNENCTGDPTGAYCNWTPVGVLFSGTAYSIDFGGTANNTGFDDITFGSNVPGKVPEPGTLALLGLGLAGLGLSRRRSAG